MLLLQVEQEGIGAATARALAADGHRVFINFVNSTQAATDLAEEIKSHGGEAFLAQADVRDDNQIKAMFDKIKHEYNSIDILVSNANMNFTAKPFLEQTWEEFSQKLNDEMHAAYMTAKYAAASMKENQFGRLILSQVHYLKVQHWVLLPMVPQRAHWTVSVSTSLKS